MSVPIVNFTPARSTRWIWSEAVRPNSYLAARRTVGLTADIPAATTGVLHLSDRSLEFAKTWSGEAS